MSRATPFIATNTNPRVTTAPHARRRRAGLSLVEVLVSLSLAAGLLVAVAAAYSASTSAIHVNDQFFRAAQAARVSVNQIMTEVRQCQSGVVDVTSLDLTTSTGEKRIYALDTETSQLRMTLPNLVPPATYTLARNVHAVKFDTDGTSVTMTLTIKIGPNELLLSGSAIPRRTLTY